MGYDNPVNPDNVNKELLHKDEIYTQTSHSCVASWTLVETGGFRYNSSVSNKQKGNEMKALQVTSYFDPKSAAQ